MRGREWAREHTQTHQYIRWEQSAPLSVRCKNNQKLFSIHSAFAMNFVPINKLRTILYFVENYLEWKIIGRGAAFFFCCFCLSHYTLYIWPYRNRTKYIWFWIQNQKLISSNCERKISKAPMKMVSWRWNSVVSVCLSYVYSYSYREMSIVLVLCPCMAFDISISWITLCGVRIGISLTHSFHCSCVLPFCSRLALYRQWEILNLWSFSVAWAHIFQKAPWHMIREISILYVIWHCRWQL